MTRPGTRNVLFLCTQNSARSILAECVLNRLGRGLYRGFSAGSHPRGEVHPLALDVLRAANYELSGLRSKSWAEFARPDAPAMDIVITVCDSAAREACPVWPGHPVTAHWGLPDPARAPGGKAEQRQAFEQTLRTLTGLVGELVDLLVEMPDNDALRARLRRIAATALPDARAHSR